MRENNIEKLSERIKELGDKSTQILLFLSFAMVSVAALESVDKLKALLPSLNCALYFWKWALIPTLLGVVPVKEFWWQCTPWYRIVRIGKVVLHYATVILIFLGISFFIKASFPAGG